MERPNAWKAYKKTELKKVEQLAEDYRRFLDNGKTERECARQAIDALEKAGYICLDEAVAAGKKLNPGDKVYVSQMGKAVLAFLIGRKPLESGMNIVGAHIDSPRIDLKQNPLYEDGDFALADTHYYGGIKKY
ncbi:MAG: aminopeptidase, partial [Clostridiales bacterium]|nr:aminopeptidase [Clostridiales bacterium]